MSIEQRLLAVIDSLVPRAPADVLGRTREEVGYGEYGVALENLCENLYETDARLPPATIAEIAAIAGEMGMEDSSWDVIQALEEWPEDRSD